MTRIAPYSPPPCWQARRLPLETVASTRAAATSQPSPRPAVGMAMEPKVRYSGASRAQLPVRYLMSNRQAQRCMVALSILTTSFALEACVTSKEALLGPDTRVLPFSTGMRFEVYERQEARDSWKKSNDAILVADDDLVVRDENHPELESFSFHPNGDRKFLVQANFGHHYAYAALEIRNGEGLLELMNCDKIDQDRFRRAGGSVVVEWGVKECRLDTASKPLELLRSIAATPSGTHRYVPIRRPSSVKGPVELNRPSEDYLRTHPAQR